MSRTLRIAPVEEIRAELEEQNPEALTADGFDAALVGIVHRKGMEPLALYDRELCIKVLTDDGASYEEAVEYLEFNVLDAYVGPGTPAFLIRPEDGAWEVEL